MSEPKSDNIQTWLELLRGFDQSRGHFAESYRHLLLGAAEAVRVMERAAADPRAGEFGGPSAVSFLELIRRGLGMWAEKIPGLLEASTFDMAKREALMTVKEVLAAERRRIEERESLSDEDRIKVDALDAITRVVDMELDRRETPPTERAASMRRVVIE